MSQIRITPETMRQRAASYHQQSETIQQVISTMDKLLRTLQDEWEGNKIANATERQDQEIAGQLGG